METYERRLKNVRAEVHFQWNDAYGVGIADIDEQHGMLFEMIDGLAAATEGRGKASLGAGDVDRLVSLARAHLKYEETLVGRNGPPGYVDAIKGHAEFSKKVEILSRYVAEAPADTLQTMVEYLKDWVIDHTLLENGRFREYLKT
jgi:hemerythrin